MNIGILGAGNIARVMSKTVNLTENVTLAAIGSRSKEKAEDFAREFGIPKAYGSYEELAADDTLDLIYIATPHSRHYEDAKLCLEKGRNVLCEKAFTANGAQARKLFEIADKKGLFISEAIWTRFLPMRSTLDSIIESGVIGSISSLTANLGYSLGNVERLIKPELAGGALLDLGVYTINFALMAFKGKVREIKSTCVKNRYGVDSNNSIIMTFEDGKTAVLHNNALSNTDRRGIIYGDKGRIEFENINCCEGINVILNDRSVTRYERPPLITGFEYELNAAVRAISEGKRECEEMPHSEILKVMDIMDGLRSEWSIRFPFE